ncbi:hypothetical protein LCGC14_0372440 [marine sediment metagenome]|uniref:Uncharacterized protein n=1 Tax=marine sediment metagenome TaxID=412755 RepID=A0A0F9WDA9_9ZZZZ
MKLTLQEAKDRFASTGECNHDPDFETEVTPYGCDNILIIQCTICGEIKSKANLNLT